MARFFKYKSAQELEAAAAERGHAMTVSADLAPLFQPVSVGGRTIGNRLTIHPMEGCDGTLDGRPDELTFRRWRRFGDGGAKLIWGEATAVADEGRMNPRQLWLGPHNVADFARLLDECRGAHRAAGESTDDLLVGLQLTHSGRYSFRRPLIATHDPLLDPYTLDKRTGARIDADYPLLTDDDLARLADQFVAVAKLAAGIGFDFVDVKQCHRYLLSELLAATNRPGKYGGSLENRTRFAREVVERIRSEAPGLIVASRMNAYDGIPFQAEGTGKDRIGVPVPHATPIVCGFGVNKGDWRQEDPTEPQQAARWFRDAGVSLLSVTAGNPYICPHFVRPAEFPPVDGYQAPEHPLDGVARHFRLARAIQAAVPEIPVIGSGYSWLQDFALGAAAAQIAAGHIQLMGYGRGVLSHPEFARTARATGGLERKLVCRTFSYCTGLMRAKHHPTGQYPTGCPPFDKEIYGPIWDEVQATRP